MPPLRLSKHDGIYVVRDDFLEAGTKSRVMRVYLNKIGKDIKEFIYCSPPAGYAQVALSWATKKMGKKSHIFVPKRNHPSLQTQMAKQNGAIIHEVYPGYMSVMRARAKEFFERKKAAMIVPWGLKDEIFHKLMTNEFIRLLKGQRLPSRIWMVWGSGAMITAMSGALDYIGAKTKIIAVQVGAEMPKSKEWPSRLYKAYIAPEKFSTEVRESKRPPFPSNLNYDAKVWQFIVKHAKNGDWFWNVAS